MITRRELLKTAMVGAAGTLAMSRPCSSNPSEGVSCLDLQSVRRIVMDGAKKEMSSLRFIRWEVVACVPPGGELFTPGWAPFELAVPVRDGAELADAGKRIVRGFVRECRDCDGFPFVSFWNNCELPVIRSIENYGYWSYLIYVWDYRFNGLSRDARGSVCWQSHSRPKYELERVPSGCRWPSLSEQMTMNYGDDETALRQMWLRCKSKKSIAAYNNSAKLTKRWDETL